MRTPLVLLKFVAKSALNAVGFGVAGDFATEVIPHLWSSWGKERSEEQRKADVQALVQAPAAEVQQQAREVVHEIAGNQPPDLQFKLLTYLSEIPAVARQSLRRPADPHGRTVAPSVRLQKAEDLLPILPQRLPRFKPGDRPLGNLIDWELVKLLGVGGFGEVWRARNPHVPHLEAALKFCLDPTAREQLLKYEAGVLARVMSQGDHPGIVRLKHTYLSADPPCLEYEFIDGGDLASTIHAHVAARGPLAPELATKIILKLARAVAHVHKLSPPIVHRDLKPANVLVRKTEGKSEFLITDFGIGGVAASQALEQARQGTTSTPLLTSLQGSHTPLYASPEQKRGEPPDPRDDVHALGVIWYQLLIGDFSEGAPAGGAWRKSLSQREGVSDKLLDLIESCFESRAADRPASAAAVVERIEVLLSPRQSATRATLTTSRNPAVFGHPLSFTATVNPVPPATGMPTGEISFMDGTTILGNAPLENGTAKLATAALAAGQHNILVSYRGDALFTACRSTPLTQEVAPALLTITARNAHKLCGQPTPDFVADFSGFAPGDSEESLSGTLSFTTRATGDSEPGSYAVTPGGLTSGNYHITFVDGTLTIAPSQIDRNSAAAYRQRARNYVNRQKYGEALAEFDVLVKLEPQVPANRIERGQVHAMSGHHDQAIDDFTQAIQAGVRTADLLTARARSYAGKGALDLAFADFEEALRLDPGNTSTHLHRGQVHEDGRAYDLALADYADAIRLDPTQGRSFSARGMVYLRKGEANRALADLIHALQLDPNLPEAYHNRGQVYASKGNYGQAVADYKQAIQLGLKSDRVYYHRGLAYARLHKPAQALADFTRAIKVSPQNAELYLMRGLAHLDRSKYADAIGDFTKAIQREAGYAVAYHNRARAYLASGKYGKAIKDFTRVIRKKPGWADAFEGRARAHCLKKQFDAALTDATEAIRLNPSCASAYAHRSRAHAGKGALEQAVADATEAIRLDAQATHYQARGLAYLGRDEYDRAIGDFSQAIKLDRKNAALYRSRARSYAKLGQAAKAASDRQKARKLGANTGKLPPRRKSPASQGVTLAQIIAAGLLVPPVKLFCRYKGTMLEAILLKDGAMKFQQQRFDSCSAAAEAARQYVTGQRQNTNGWTFWRYQGADGKSLRLADARKQLVRGSKNILR